MAIIGIMLALVAAGLVAIGLRGPNLPGGFATLLARETASDSAHPHPLVTEAYIAALPAPVQRYIRVRGAIGRPHPASLTVT